MMPLKVGPWAWNPPYAFVCQWIYGLIYVNNFCYSDPAILRKTTYTKYMLA